MTVETIAERVAQIHKATTTEQILDVVLNALHDIGGSYSARLVLSSTESGSSRRLTEPLKKSMKQKAFTDEAIEELALAVWGAAALRMVELHGVLAESKEEGRAG